MVAPVSDEQLMLLCQEGDDSALRELFYRYRKGVYSYIYRYTNSSEDTEEIFQEAFLKLYRALPNYHPSAKFTTWLFTIVRNLCIDYHRKKRLRNHLSLDEFSEEGDPVFVDALIAPVHEMPDAKRSEREVFEILEKALQTLSEEQREVFLMREKMGLKFEEIAQLIGISINTVKSRMRYALENLRKFLEKSGNEELKPAEYR